MTEEDKKLISSFEGKLRHFMFLHDELKQENANLKLLLNQKDEEIKQLEQSRKELEARYTDLKTARTISLYDRDIKDTKQRLTGLVREVGDVIPADAVAADIQKMERLPGSIHGAPRENSENSCVFKYYTVFTSFCQYDILFMCNIFNIPYFKGA